MENLTITEKAEKLVEKIDMVELHKELALSNSGSNIIIWSDGTIDTLTAGTMPNTEDEYILMKAWGIGNIDSGTYSEGFYTQTDEQHENCLFFNPETKKELELEEMVAECIEDGCWDDFATGIEETIKRDMETEAAYY